MKFFQRNEDTGLLELIDGESGEVVAVEKRPDPNQVVFQKKKFLKHTDKNGKEYYLESGLSPADVGRGVRRWQPTEGMKSAIVQLYGGDGAPSLTKICKMDGFPPYHDVCRWRREDEDFDKALKQARVDRAEVFADKAVETAESLEDANRDEVSVGKLKVDTYKWAAEKHDPEKFGNKTKVVGDANAPLSLNIITGVPQPAPPNEEPKEKAIEGKEVKPLHTNPPKLVNVTKTELDAE